VSDELTDTGRFSITELILFESEDYNPFEHFGEDNGVTLTFIDS